MISFVSSSSKYMNCLSLKKATLSVNFQSRWKAVRWCSYIAERGEIHYMDSQFKGGDVLDKKNGRRPSLIVTPIDIAKETKAVVMAPLSNANGKKNTKFSFIISKKTTSFERDSLVNTAQLFTTSITHFSKNSCSGICLTDENSWKEINERLETAISIFAKFKHGITPKFTQGKVVRIVEGPALGLLGVIVSNDVGNHFSKIVMISSLLTNKLSNFEVPVNLKSVNSDDLYAHCGQIDTLSQTKIEPVEDLPKNTLDTIYSKLRLTVGLPKLDV